MKGLKDTSLFQKLRQTILFLLLILLPSQLGKHFWPDFAYVAGVRVDYLSPTLYITDILIILLVILTPKKFKLYLLPIIFVVINIVFALNPMIAILRWVKVGELVFLVYLIYKQEILKRSSILKILFYATVIYVLIGVLQFINNGSLGGVFYWLGERRFNINSYGITLVDFLGQLKVRSYSTFSHPNSLAGYLGVLIILLTLYGRKLLSKTNYFLILFIYLSGFVLAFSRNAVLSLLLVLFIPKKWWVLAFVPIFFLATDLSYQERVLLISNAYQVIIHHPLLGVGLGNSLKLAPITLLQPVHNIYLLVLEETGLVGFFVIVYIFIKNKLWSLPMIFVLLTGFWDHYWLTLPQNLLLLAVIIGVSLSNTHAKT